jgi:hypothetical protein
MVMCMVNYGLKLFINKLYCHVHCMQSNYHPLFKTFQVNRSDSFLGFWKQQLFFVSMITAHIFVELIVLASIIPYSISCEILWNYHHIWNGVSYELFLWLHQLFWNFYLKRFKKGVIIALYGIDDVVWAIFVSVITDTVRTCFIYFCIYTVYWLNELIY